jgi:valyl-tRNA synthetase
MSSNLLPKGYEPKEVEKRWYDFWEKEGLFAAKQTSDQPGYSIVIPPPNVTGVLHMGHALNITMQDILCRHRRSRGDNVLWMPGTDHAGIATQNVVERKLAAEGSSRHKLGRDKFIEAVWKWRKEYGGAIINQLKRLGASCDWQRERFTMDEGLSTAVRKVFVDLYDQGLIYRGDYIINWCCRCHTALADLEVEHEEIEGHLYHIRYPYADGSGFAVVATTRPETMLGDTAVAMHPDDERYRNLTAQNVILPLMEKEIPIIRDTYVDMEFGTGALKVTPAHDPNDFEIGNRHSLENVKVIGDDGHMTTEAGRFAGLDRFEARKQVVLALEEADLLVKIEEHPHNVGHCYRCKTIIEPNLSKQWFVSAKPLAEKAIAAVKNKKTNIIPEVWTKTYYDWMNNIRDWCISRQIWWGHQIPAWTCQDCGEVIVAVSAPTVCPACSKNDLIQESDVLDTWFSSALWPFSTMGWPENTPLLKTFYPTAVLVTGFDILFFWVARMMMMGIHFMDDVPFKDVYVHALVRDEHGKKMSKSKGNVIDPLDTIETYGTDAFRFTLAAFAAQGRDIKMSGERVEGYRHFINKLWNASRFVLMNVETGYADLPGKDISLADRWILLRLADTTRSVDAAIATYRFNDAASALYKFVWHEFCDWYLEAVKPALYGDAGDSAKTAAQNTLWFVLRDTLILLHPFTPFVTEEIWHKLPGASGSIMAAAYPLDRPDSNQAAIDPEAENQMALLIEVITGVRTIRGEMNISPATKLNAIVHVQDNTKLELLAAHQNTVVHLARLKSLDSALSGAKPPTAASAIVDGATVFIPLEGVVDIGGETKRLAKEIKKITAELETVTKKLNNQGFLAKAPEAVVAKVRDKYNKGSAKLEKLQANLKRFEALGKNE